MINKLGVVFLLVLIQNPIVAQTRVLLAANNATFKHYEQYATPLKIIPKYSSLKEVDNKTIEDIIASILCETSQEWVNFNTLGGEKSASIKSEDDFQKIRNRDNSKTFIELLSKMDFDIMGQDLSIVKFKLYVEQVPKGVTGTFQLQKVGNRWYKTSRTDMSKIGLLMMFIKSQVISDLLAGKSTGNKEFDKLLKNVSDNQELNFDKLYNEFSLWETDKQKTDLFTEPAW
jgi:hypothetical protein